MRLRNGAARMHIPARAPVYVHLQSMCSPPSRWRKSRARPANMPSNPNRVYQDHGWRGYGHWLGNTNGQSRPARATAHEPAMTARETSPCTNRKRSATTQATPSVRGKRPAARGLRD